MGTAWGSSARPTLSGSEGGEGIEGEGGLGQASLLLRLLLRLLSRKGPVRFGSAAFRSASGSVRAANSVSEFSGSVNSVRRVLRSAVRFGPRFAPVSPGSPR
eukprot:4620717-Pyramimonas_sp.AAC.1